MIWILIIGVIIFFLFRFFMDYKKDDYDLASQKLDEKFSVVVNILNKHVFDGKGKITYKDQRLFNLYRDKENQIIYFKYATGHLTIIWKYKYFQKEIIHEKTFHDVRNLSVFEQKEIGEILIEEMNQVVAKHKKDVLNR